VALELVVKDLPVELLLEVVIIIHSVNKHSKSHVNMKASASIEEKRVTTVLDFNRPLYDCLPTIKEMFCLTDKENINISLIHSTRASTYGLERTFELNLSSSLREHKIPTRALLIVRVSEIETRERDSSDPILVDKNIWEEGPDSKDNIVYDNRDGSIVGGTLNKLIMVLTSEKKSGMLNRYY